MENCASCGNVGIDLMTRALVVDQDRSSAETGCSVEASKENPSLATSAKADCPVVCSCGNQRAGFAGVIYDIDPLMRLVVLIGGGTNLCTHSIHAEKCVAGSTMLTKVS